MSDHLYWCCDEGHYHPDNQSPDGPTGFCECGARMRRVEGDWIAGRRIGFDEGKSRLVAHLLNDTLSQGCHCDYCKNLRPLWYAAREERVLEECEVENRRRAIIASQLANQKRYTVDGGAVAILLADAMAVCGYPDSESFDAAPLAPVVRSEADA